MQEEDSKVEMGNAPVPAYVWVVIVAVLAWAAYYWVTYRTPSP